MVSARWRTAAIVLLVAGTLQWLMCLARGEERGAVVPKTVKPMIEKGFRPEVMLSPFGPPVERYAAPVLQLPPGAPMVEGGGRVRRIMPPLIIRRCKWPCERSA